MSQQQQQQQHQQQFSSTNMNEDDEYLAEDEDNEVFFYNERKASSSSSSSSSNNFNPNFYNPFEIKHRRRTSRGQFKILEKAFIDNPKPNAKTRQGLAESLSMTPRGVQVWFQNRRAKAKQQQDNNGCKKSHDTTVDDLQVSSSTYYSPIVLSSSGMIHNRSQSSSSSSTTYSTKNDIHVISSSAATITTENNNCAPPPPQVAWYNSNSDAASTVTEEMISSSPLLLTPPQPEQEIVSSDKQDDYCWWVDDVSTIIGSHQTLFNNQAPAAILVNDTQPLMKTDPFTTANTTNAAAADHHLDAWAYIDSLQINSNSENSFLATTTTAAATMNTVTKSLDNIATYNRHVVDWISSTKAACNIQDDLLGILDSNTNDCDYIPQQQQQKFTKPITVAVDNRRHSYPPVPFEQDESYWAGQQIMRRLSEPNHHPSEPELVNSYYLSNNHYSAINITL